MVNSIKHKNNIYTYYMYVFHKRTLPKLSIMIYVLRLRYDSFGVSMLNHECASILAESGIPP